jgi:hypothetical protein
MENLDLSSALICVAESLAKTKADELAVKKGLSVPKEQYIETEKSIILGSLQHSWDTVAKQVEKGQEALERHLLLLPAEERGKVKKELGRAAAELKKMGTNLSLDSEPLQKKLGLHNSTLLVVYEVGYQCFKDKEFDEAFALFLTLTLLNSRVVDYWIALGSTQRALHSEKAALYSFSLVSLLDPSNTLSRIHCIEIYLHLQKPKDALEELEAFSEIIEEKKLDSLKPQWKLLKEKIDSNLKGK